MNVHEKVKISSEVVKCLTKNNQTESMLLNVGTLGKHIIVLILIGWSFEINDHLSILLIVYINL